MSTPLSAVPVISFDEAAHSLEADCRQHRRDWTTRLVETHLAGDTDVRLLVSRAGSPLTVELLGPYADTSSGDRWQAVLAGPDGRTVWSGPPRPCPHPVLVGFIADLLSADRTQISDRYCCLG
jgi:hypothetical protein